MYNNKTSDIQVLLGKLLPAIRQDSGEFIFQQDCHSAQNTLVFCLQGTWR